MNAPSIMNGKNSNLPSHQRTIGLGIDVGGTFSDSVLIDLDSGHILSKAKSPTTHDALSKGIEVTLGFLEKELLPHVRMVSLSTTLATNALVEGRKSRVTAIMPGYKTSHCPDEFLSEIHLVKGGHTVKGDVMNALDLEEVGRIIEFTCGQTEAYAVSSYFSTRNPEHELSIRALIQRLAPNIPIVCGHELSHKLNAKLRATTTILNAHLIPLIRGLLASVKKVLGRYSITAPLMVVKGDGSLFCEKMCEEKPVETILSGPAASVVGAGYLISHTLEKAVVIDIGGTTSDIAVLQNGSPRLNTNGVTIGPWQTHVTAVDVRTVGLGGDSHIKVAPKGEILLGPKRVEPLCLLEKRVPITLSKFQAAVSKPIKDSRFTPASFWFRTRKKVPDDLSFREKKILAVVSDAARNIFEIANALGSYPITLFDELSRLENRALIGYSGFTLTDIFHIRKVYEAGNREYSLLAAHFLAGQKKMDLDAFLSDVENNFHRKAALHIVDSISISPIFYSGHEQSCPACKKIWHHCFRGHEDLNSQAETDPFRMQLQLDVPLVALGAPAHILAPSLAKRIKTKAYIPEHAEVGSALGAIVGTILVSDQVLIRPLSPKDFVCFTSAGKFVYSTLEEAIDHGREFLTEYLQTELKRAGGNESEINIWEDRKEAKVASGEKILIEILLHGQAAAKPKFQREFESLN